MSQSEAQQRATKKYHQKFENIQIRVPKGEKGLICNHAQKKGESLTAFIRRAIKETMERD